MKTRLILMLTAVFIAVVAISCSDDAKSDEDAIPDEDSDGVINDPDNSADDSDAEYLVPAGPVSFKVYKSGGGNTVYAEFELPQEGDVKMEFVPKMTSDVFILASRQNAYSSIYKTKWGETVNVKLDPVENDGLVHGMVFDITPGTTGTISYYTQKESVLVDAENENTSIITDESGRFHAPQNEYVSAYSYYGNYYSMVNIPEEERSDACMDIIIPFEEDMGDTADTGKPNIYLYPAKTMDLSVEISFPQGGSITKSDPEYGKEWNVSVEPDGTIDGQHSYLFYEADVPPRYQEEKGYVVKREDLEYFFSEHLEESGITGQEKDDFLEWWIPRLLFSEYFVIYPQYENDIKDLIEISFSVQPDNFRRLYYLVKTTDDPASVKIEPPEIPEFKREGFFGVEWGVVFYYNKNLLK